MKRARARFDALVSYPGWGSLWLDDVRLRDGFVVGTASFPHPADASYPEPLLMNFPLTCVRKLERRPAPEDTG